MARRATAGGPGARRVRPHRKDEIEMSTDRSAYMTGFGNEFATEALPGTLPVGQNSPQRVAHGLYAEQLSGSAFTAPRGQNRRSWLYRIRPAAMHGTFSLLDQPRFHNGFGDGPVTPDQLRWDPLPLPATPSDFVDGLYTVAGNGSPAAQQGVGIHLYVADRDMATQRLQGRLVEDLRDQAHVLVDEDLVAVADGDAGGLLAPVL